MNKVFYILLLILVIIMPPPSSSNFNSPATLEELKPAQIIEKDAGTAHAKVVLITIDGVRWQDVFIGPSYHQHSYPLLYKGKIVPARELIPNLYNNFVDKGSVFGKDSFFIATGPHHISLPGYLEIMRGHPSFDCQENDCNPKIEDTIADLFETSAVFASWETIEKAVGKNTDRFVVNCGRNFRSNGWKQLGLFDKNDFPEAWSPDYRPDSVTQSAVFDYLQNNNPQFLWVSLGDTDEWAHAGNYDEYINALIESDKFVGQLVSQLSSPDTTFIVTADHGRGKDWRNHGWDVESSKNWLMMTGRLVPAVGFTSRGRTKSLSNILPTVKHLISGEHQQGSLIRGR